MWHLYHLLAPGDNVTAVTFRKVQKENETGLASTNKVKLKLTLCLESVDFDPATCSVRLKGRNVMENEWVKLGGYHTLELELNHPFTLEKPEWDSMHLERLEMACDPTQSAELAAVVMQQGIAHVCLITPHLTLLRAKIEVHVPKKRVGSSTGHDKALTRFYDAVAEAIKRHINFKVVKCVLLASPAHIKNDFFAYLIAEAQRTNNREILENKSKFLLCHSSSGFKHSLKEVLADPTVRSRIEDTKAFAEVRALEAFYEMLNTDPDRAFYGLKHVLKANEHKAIDTLLVTDELFRSSDVQTRKTYVDLVESVRENGGQVRVFSAMHVSGEQLAKLSGVAALLRFPLPDIAEEEAHVSDSEDEDASRRPPATERKAAPAPAGAAGPGGSVFWAEEEEEEDSQKAAEDDLLSEAIDGLGLRNSSQSKPGR